MLEDPRIDELMDHIDDVDEHGEPTSIALIARRVDAYLDVVDDLREDLAKHHKFVEDLEERASNLRSTLLERDTLRGDITDQAQTAAMKAAVAITTAQGAQLRQDAMEKQKALKQFEADYARDEQRYKEAMRALESRHLLVMETRDQIARRMNIIDALLQRAEIDWPSYFFEENERLKAKNKTATSSTRRRGGRGRGRRRIIRRRRAA